MKNNELQNMFEYELKRKIAAKARFSSDEIKILLNSFKFYDLYATGLVNKPKWIQAILKCGITGFSENDLEFLFSNYDINNSGEIDYKNFCLHLYGREQTDSQTSTINQNEQNFFNKFSRSEDNYNKKRRIIQNDQSENIFNNYQKIKTQNSDLEIISKIKNEINVNDGVIFYTFLKYLNINQDPLSGKLTLGDLNTCFQDLNLNISSDEITKLFNYLDNEKSRKISSDNIINFIKGNSMEEKRKIYLIGIFSSIDTQKQGAVSVTILKQKYNAKMHPDVLSRKKSEEEIFSQFCFTLDVYIRVNNIMNNEITFEQFIDYYSGISPSIADDKRFEDILNKVWGIDNDDTVKSSNNQNYNDEENIDYDEMGINSLFLGISKSKRPKYNYDYLKNLKNLNNYQSSNNKINTESNNTNNYNLRKQLSQRNYDNPYKLYNYKNYTVNTNQSLEVPIYLEQRRTESNDFKGKKMYRSSKRYNPITDEYFENNTNNNNLNTPNVYKSYDGRNYNYKNINIDVNNNEKKNSNEEINITKNVENVPIIENNNNIINNVIKENEALIELRKMLISKGPKSIFRFQRMLSIFDRNHSGNITFENYFTIFQIYNINLNIDSIKSIFELFSTDENKTQIKYDNLFKSILGTISSSRQNIINKLYESFNKDSNGKIMMHEIKNKFNSSKHPEVISGAKNSGDIFGDFLDFLETFREYNDNLNGGYSFNFGYTEFFNFMSEISFGIEDDKLFEDIINNCFGLSEVILNEEETKKENNDTNNNNEVATEKNINNRYNNNENIRMKAGNQIIGYGNNNKF